MIKEKAPDINRTNDPKVNILLLEYQLAVELYKEEEARLFQIAGGGIAIIGTLASFLAGQSNQLPMWLALISPGVATGILLLLVRQYFEFEGNIRKCRIISRQINIKFKETLLSQFSGDSYGGEFYSIRHGNIYYRIVLYALMSIVAILFITVSFLSINRIYTTNHLYGVLYCLGLIALGLVLALGLIGAISDLPRYFNAVEAYVQSTGRFPEKVQSLSYKENPALSLLLPRPQKIFDTGIVFWYGFVGALALVGVGQSQFRIITTLFVTGESYTAKTVPLWTIGMVGLIYFVLEEVVLQQAKLLWDDIRDAERDRKSFHSQNRPYIAMGVSESVAASHVLVRILIAFILGLVVGGLPLFVLFVLIIIHQILYMFWAKPLGHKHPKIPLAVLSFNVVFRFAAGFIAVTGGGWSYLPTLIIFTVFYFYSFGFLATFWMIEMAHAKKHPEIEFTERPQSSYFYENGEKFQKRGHIAAVLLALVLLGFERFSVYCQPSLNRTFLIAKCTNQGIEFQLLSITLGVLVSILLILAMYQVGKLLLFIIQPISRFVSKAITTTKGIAYPLAWLAAFLCFYKSITTNSTGSWYFAALLLINIGMFLYMEGMTYEDYAGLEMRRQLPILFRKWYEYIFRSTSSMGFSGLLRATITVFSNKKVFSDDNV